MEEDDELTIIQVIIESADGHPSEEGFSVVKKLAEGAYSKVFLVEEAESQKKVVMKDFVALNDDHEIKIKMELKAHKICGPHPNIVGLLRAGVNRLDRSSCLIMPWITEGNIEKEMKERRGEKKYLQEGRVVTTARGLASALSFIHSKGYAHRGVELTNILIDRRNRPLLCDFGAATVVPLEVKDSIHKQKVIDETAELYSMTFWAPELFTADIKIKITTAVDVWSFGCVVYALCHFVSPFELAREEGHIIAKAVRRPELISYPVDAPFDHRLFDVVRECLVVDPNRRPSMSLIEKNLDEIMVVDSEIV